MPDAVLVTGGAGYIGSHVVRQLVDAGHRVVVLDDLSSGHRWAVAPEAEFVHGDVADAGLLAALLGRHRIAAVLHFAGSIVVPESVADPLGYYRNNVCASRTLIEACVKHDVRKFVFSSTAAVYGIPDEQPIGESAPLRPINPYGTTKLVVEWMLRDAAAADLLAGAPPASAFRYVILRYFNVAGARLDGRLGQAGKGSTHLLKVACEAAVGLRPKITVFGTDYPTRDGTCIRDYIHVEDLARAHLQALDYLAAGGSPEVLNCGYGRGYSVREVLDALQRVGGLALDIEHGARRAGDPPQLVAEASRIRRVLGWQPAHDDLDLICRTALQWETRFRSIRDNTVGGSAS
jgi:UDP-glucose 4-epimerase